MIADFGLRIADCSQPLIPLPPGEGGCQRQPGEGIRLHLAGKPGRIFRPLVPSPQPPAPARRGASILEVMFAIMVATIGLLGAVAIFPVASAQARKGRINDAVAIAGRSAVNVVDARGMRRPSQWVAWNSSTTAWNTFSLPLVDGLSYCIDPRFVGMHNQPISTNADRANASSFPHGLAASSPQMQRITLLASVPPSTIPMTKLQADSIFMYEDDLTINRFSNTVAGAAIAEDRSELSRPAAQGFYRIDHDSDPLTQTIPLKRNSAGNLSWMATLVPKHELYLNSPTTGAPRAIFDDQYVLSIIVFHQRPAGMELNVTSERVLGADFGHVGGVGFAGGETMLTWAGTAADVDNAKEMLKVRAGDWIMLAKQVVHADGTTPKNIFRWYRITDTEPEPEFDPAENHWHIAVSLSGQDWEVTPGVQDYAIVVSGVVGVYEKTVRLEAF